MKLSDLAKDKVTGLEGVITGHARHFNNVDRMFLQPQGVKDTGKTKDGEWFDVTRLEYVGPTDIEARSTGTMPFSYGDLVVDKLTGLRGRAVGYVTYLGGCLQVGIQPDVKKDGVPVEWQWLPVFQLKLVKAASKSITKNDNGGPAAPMLSSMRDAETR